MLYENANQEKGLNDIIKADFLFFRAPTWWRNIFDNQSFKVHFANFAKQGYTFSTRSLTTLMLFLIVLKCIGTSSVTSLIIADVWD